MLSTDGGQRLWTAWTTDRSDPDHTDAPVDSAAEPAVRTAHCSAWRSRWNPRSCTHSPARWTPLPGWPTARLVPYPVSRWVGRWLPRSSRSARRSSPPPAAWPVTCTGWAHRWRCRRLLARARRIAAGAVGNGGTRVSALLPVTVPLPDPPGSSGALEAVLGQLTAAGFCTGIMANRLEPARVLSGWQGADAVVAGAEVEAATVVDTDLHHGVTGALARLQAHAELWSLVERRVAVLRQQQQRDDYAAAAPRLAQLLEPMASAGIPSAPPEATALVAALAADDAARGAKHRALLDELAADAQLTASVLGRRPATGRHRPPGRDSTRHPAAGRRVAGLGADRAGRARGGLRRCAHEAGNGNRPSRGGRGVHAVRRCTRLRGRADRWARGRRRHLPAVVSRRGSRHRR